MMGLNRTSLRVRLLINWLITSLLRLKHHPVTMGTGGALVIIYGPRVRYDRGCAIAFNVLDIHGKLIHPQAVHACADRLNIRLGLGFLHNVRFPAIHFDDDDDNDGYGDDELGSVDALPLSVGRPCHRRCRRVQVLTAALGLLSDFDDVYRLWAFVARFLNPDYVSNDCILEQDKARTPQ
jgi:selenocysteine lyase/cysteine desulfurase